MLSCSQEVIYYFVWLGQECRKLSRLYPEGPSTQTYGIYPKPCILTIPNIETPITHALGTLDPEGIHVVMLGTCCSSEVVGTSIHWQATSTAKDCERPTWPRLPRSLGGFNK